MARNQQKKQQEISSADSDQSIDTLRMSENDRPDEPHHHSSIELDDTVVQQGADINLGGKHIGGPTGGDLKGGGKGPAIGDTHPGNDATADHYGSREETQAALEGKIASQNTLKLHGQL